MKAIIICDIPDCMDELQIELTDLSELAIVGDSFQVFSLHVKNKHAEIYARLHTDDFSMDDDDTCYRLLIPGDEYNG